MMQQALIALAVFFLSLHPASFSDGDGWLNIEQNAYTIYYSSQDENEILEYVELFKTGKQMVGNFFQFDFAEDFNVYIHPDRASLDQSWQTDWNMPEFKSQCWMIASGVASKLDILSPCTWDSLACEHSYSDSIKTQRLITHEMVHVFHGQHNPSPYFSDISGLDWFVEGLAVYASGQCDHARIEAVKKDLSEGLVPGILDEFFTGEHRYGLSGTVLMYLDHKYGREMICELLKFNRKEELLNYMGTTEEVLLEGWKLYMNNIN